MCSMIKVTDRDLLCSRLLVPSSLPCRCAQLILIAASNELEEVWVGAFPVLHLQYLGWYMPTLHAPIGRRIAKMLARTV